MTAQFRLFSYWIAVLLGWIVCSPTMAVGQVQEPAPAEEIQIQNEPAAANPQINLSDAIQLATDYDSRYQQILWRIEQSQGNRLQATRRPNPSVGVVSNEIGNLGQAGQYGLFFSQNVVRSGRLRFANQVYSNEILALQQSLDVRSLQIARSITEQCLEIGRIRQQLHVTESHITSLKEIQKIIQDLFQVGEVSEIETTSIDIEIDRVQQNVLGNQQDLRTRLAQLELRLQPSDGPPESIAENGELEINFQWNEVAKQLADHSQYQPDELWIASHPQIRFAEMATETARSKIALAKSQRCPDYQLQASVNYDFDTRDFFGTFQVGIPILKNDRKNGAVAAAQADYHRAIEFIRQRKRQLRQQQVRQAGERQKLLVRSQYIRENMIPKVVTNLAQVKRSFQAGETQYLQVKVATDQALASRLSLVKAEYELGLAQIRLETLIIDED